MTPQEAAIWMEAEILRVRFLDHETVIAYLLAVDPELVGYNDSGNPKIAPAVLRAFGKRKDNQIVWSRSALHWRLREAGDEDGRLVS